MTWDSTGGLERHRPALPAINLVQSGTTATQAALHTNIHLFPRLDMKLVDDCLPPCMLLTLGGRRMLALLLDSTGPTMWCTKPELGLAQGLMMTRFTEQRTGKNKTGQKVW